MWLFFMCFLLGVNNKYRKFFKVCFSTQLNLNLLELLNFPDSLFTFCANFFQSLFSFASFVLVDWQTIHFIHILGARKLEKYWTNQTYQNYLEKGTALVSRSLTRKIIAINLESEQNFPNKIKAELMGHKKVISVFIFLCKVLKIIKNYWLSHSIELKCFGILVNQNFGPYLNFKMSLNLGVSFGSKPNFKPKPKKSNHQFQLTKR